MTGKRFFAERTISGSKTRTADLDAGNDNAPLWVRNA